MKISDLPLLRPTRLFSLPTSSASGLVRVGGALYVISDDALNLSEISHDGTGRSIPILEGDLPEDPAERKAAKPDFESLFLFHDQLVGLGSGSTVKRSTGFTFPKGKIKKGELPQTFSLAPLYDVLREKIRGLNIEGAVHLGSEVVLFQRGNTGNAFSGLIRLDAEKLHEGLASEVGPSALISIHDLSHELPPEYGFTDAAIDPRKENTIWFLAVREESDNPYDDGAFTGAVIGELLLPKSGSPSVHRMTALEIETKPEGLWLEPSDDDKLTAFLVTDADCLTIPSALYAMEINAVTR